MFRTRIIISTALRAQTNGHILIGGSFTSVNGTARTNIACLNVDGTLDDSFEAGSIASGQGGFVNSRKTD